MPQSDEILKRIEAVERLLEQLKSELAQQQASEGHPVKSEVVVPHASSAPTSKGSDTLLEKGSDVPKVSSEPAQLKQAAPEGSFEDLVTNRSLEEDEEDKGPPIGEVGTFEGEFVIMPNGKRYQVPPNYASKTKLVVGDKLRLLSHGDQNEFKLVEQVERVEEEGILTKKNFLWTVVIDSLEFQVIPAAVRYYGGDIGDNVTVLLPVGYEESRPKWAAVVSIRKADVSAGGYAGSRSASDIERDKKMKYVKRDRRGNPNDPLEEKQKVVVPMEKPKKVESPVMEQKPVPGTPPDDEKQVQLLTEAESGNDVSEATSILLDDMNEVPPLR